mmetsp:Transcript_6710/g.22327  ORF Transcript_6710/g.22327 Transcript_6710/m.22327 type:complete len:200 (-) Transcript_6710:706-1305(-)
MDLLLITDGRERHKSHVTERSRELHELVLAFERAGALRDRRSRRLLSVAVVQPRSKSRDCELLLCSQKLCLFEDEHESDHGLLRRSLGPRRLPHALQARVVQNLPILRVHRLHTLRPKEAQLLLRERRRRALCEREPRRLGSARRSAAALELSEAARHKPVRRRQPHPIFLLRLPAALHHENGRRESPSVVPLRCSQGV